MLTPQDIQEISFEKVLFGGYDMDSVDEFLEPLTEDYVTLYKENSVLKSKMRILVEKLEEYRKQETSMQSALLAAQKTCDTMVAEAEKKCAQMLRDAESVVEAKNSNAGVRADEEEARLENAQKATAQFLNDIEKRLNRQLELINEFRNQEMTPAKTGEKKGAFDFDAEMKKYPSAEDKADAIIEAIGQSVEEAVTGSNPNLSTEEPTRRIETIHGVQASESWKKFDDLQFGAKYDPMNNN